MIDTTSRALGDSFRTLFAGGTLTGLGEGELLERFLSGRDESAFAELVARHGPMVLSVCRRRLDDPEEVEDAFQATFLVLVRKAAGLRDRRALGPWLFGVACRVSRHARSSRARRRAKERRIPPERRRADDPSAALSGREILLVIDEEIRRLPSKQREAAVLALVEGMTHQAAAHALGWPLGTFKTRIADARATLARRLSRRGVGPGALALLARPESAIFPKVVLPERLVRRALEAATASAAAGLAGKTVRGMLIGPLTTVAVGLAVACALIVPGWWGEQPDESPPAPAVVQAPPPPRLDRHGDRLPAGAVLRLGTVKYRQETPIYRVAFADDGRKLVTDGDDGKLRIWDAGTGRILRLVDPQAGASSDFAITSDGKTAMVAGFNLDRDDGSSRNVAFTDLDTGRIVSRASWPEPEVIGELALCPDRGLLAFALHKAKHAVIRDARTGTEVDRIPLPKWPSRMSFSADGKRLAIEFPPVVLRSKGEVRVRDVERKVDIRTIEDSLISVGDLLFSPDGSRLAVANNLGVRVWEVATGKRIALDEASMKHVAFTPDGKRLVGISGTGRIATWDLAERKEINAFETGIEPVIFAASPDGRALVATGGPHVLHLWESGKPGDRFRMDDAHRDAINALTFTQDGKELLSAGEDGTVRLWDLEDGRLLRTYPHKGRVRAMRLSADGQSLATGTSSPVRISVWKLDEVRWPKVATLPFILVGSPLAIRFKANETAVEEIDSYGKIFECDLKRPVLREVWALPETDRDPIFDRVPEHHGQAAYLDGGRRIAVVGYLRGTRVLDLDARKENYSKPNGGRFAVSPDSSVLAVSRGLTSHRMNYRRLGPGLRDASSSMITEPTGASIDLIDARTGVAKYSITVPNSGVWALAFSPDGKTLAATSGWDIGRIHLYDVANGRETRTIEAPSLRSPALAFTPDGSSLITGMADGSILVWDLK